MKIASHYYALRKGFITTDVLILLMSNRTSISSSWAIALVSGLSERSTLCAQPAPGLAQVGVLNVVGLAIPELRDQPATLASLEGESIDERIQRSLSRWTPTALEEPAP